MDDFMETARSIGKLEEAFNQQQKKKKR